MKFNNGQGAILCSNCSIIIKKGNEFTDLEKEFLKGIITYLPEYFCEECKMISKKEFIFSTILSIMFAISLLILLANEMWFAFICMGIALALVIKYSLFKEK